MRKQRRIAGGALAIAVVFALLGVIVLTRPRSGHTDTAAPVGAASTTTLRSTTSDVAVPGGTPAAGTATRSSVAAPNDAATGSHFAAAPAVVAVPDDDPAVAAPSRAGRVAFISRDAAGTSNLYTVNADGTGLRSLSPVSGSQWGSVRWSPDGARLAYIDDPGVITLINQDGSGRRQLTAGGALVVELAWSPDGTEIAYTTVRPKGAYVTYSIPGISTDGDISIISVDGVAQQPVTADTNSDSSPVWSLDGRSIAFLRYGAAGLPNGLFIVDRNGLGLRAVYDADLYDFDWSADRTAFVVTGIVARPYLETINADGSDGRRLQSSEFGYGGVKWSPDAATLAVVRMDSADSPPKLYLVAADGSHEALTRTEATSPAWLPDGQSLVFCAPDGLWRINRDGSGAARLYQTGVCWRPDVHA